MQSHYFDSDPSGKFVMLGSKMIFQSSAMFFFLIKMAKPLIKSSPNLQTNLNDAVQSCLKLNLSLLIANNGDKFISMMTTLSGLQLKYN